jgi:hypothetical protein
MSPETLASLAGILLSLLFSYIPGFATWYDPLSPNLKRLIMLALLALVSGGSFALACANWPDVSATCDQAGAIDLTRAFIAAMIANQTAYALSPKKS